MQYKVPQHVDIEDKVVGSLTIRQFIIVLVGAAIVGMLKLLLVGPLSYLFWPLAIVIGLLFGAVAFGKYGDINLEVFILSAFKTFTSPRKRVWQKEPYVAPKPEAPKPIVKEGPADTRVSLTAAHENLERLAEVVDSGGYASIIDRTQASETADILAQGEAPHSEIDTLIDEASKIAPQREELVSQAASVIPDETLKETAGIKLRKDQFYKEIR